jgi:MFS family permease
LNPGRRTATGVFFIQISAFSLRPSRADLGSPSTFSGRTKCQTAAANPALKPGYRYVVLTLLIIVYTFNFLDRQILGILKDSIQVELGLTDTQVGVMGGIAFAALYSILGIPIAWLADRASRSWIMTTALTVWSGFTVACGYAGSFWALFLMRMGVGVGEAGGVAPAYSLIADYFPPRQRARALAAFSFGIPVGMALGILLGGLIAAHVNWRTAFIVVGIAGLVIAPIFKLMVKDPVRGGLDRAEGAPPPEARPKAPPFGQVVKTVLPKPSFWLPGLRCGLVRRSAAMASAFWLPSFFQRSMGMDPDSRPRATTAPGSPWSAGSIGIFARRLAGRQAGQGREEGGLSAGPGHRLHDRRADVLAGHECGPLWVVKSQIHAGGRGKGKFKEPEAGEKGGVRLAKSVDEAAEFARQMLGNAPWSPSRPAPPASRSTASTSRTAPTSTASFYLSLLVDRADQPRLLRRLDRRRHGHRGSRPRHAREDPHLLDRPGHRRQDFHGRRVAFALA